MGEARDGIHDLDAVLFGGQALVDFQEGDDVFYVPQVRHGIPAVDLAIDGVFEQDGSHDALAVKAGTLDDPAAHGVHQREHLVVVRVLVLVDAVELEGFRGAPAALIQGGDEAFPDPYLLELFVVHFMPPVDRTPLTADVYSAKLSISSGSDPHMEPGVRQVSNE